MSDITRFYRGECGNGSGDTIDDILTWSDDKLEVDHDYIQWLFPSNEQSMLNSDAPVFSREDEAAFKDDVTLREKQVECFKRMMWFYGFAVNDIGRAPSLDPLDPHPGEPHPQHALHGFNHNMLRITRILKSMRLTGNGDYTAALSKALHWLHDNNIVTFSANTWKHWDAAANDDLWSGPSVRQRRIPGDLGTVTAKYSMENQKEVGQDSQPQPNNLTSQDVVKTGTDIGKDVLKQSAVWVLAGALTKVVRQAIDGITRKQQP